MLSHGPPLRMKDDGDSSMMQWASEPAAFGTLCTRIKGFHSCSLVAGIQILWTIIGNAYVL